jgi:hypothetical protein
MPMHSLAQAVALLAPEAGDALLPLASRQAIIAHCHGLPPVVDGLFEFRLAADKMAVGVQQRVGQASHEIDVLQRYLADLHDSSIPEQTAMLLSHLLAEWQMPSSPLFETISEAWLEYEFDNGLAGSDGSTIDPTFIIGLSQSLLSPDERWLALQSALDILMEGEWRGWREGLLRTMVACPPEAFVSDIGVRMGRSTPALRVKVKRLRLTTLARYLEDVAWQENVPAAVAIAERLFHFADYVTLCLDVGFELYPHLGFECFLNSHSATEPRWGALLDDLVEQGLCSPAKRDAFLGWAGMTTPLLTDRDWPDHLITESLTRPANHLSVLQRRFGHIAVVYEEGKPLRARGYLRFLAQWLKLE